MYQVDTHLRLYRTDNIQKFFEIQWRDVNWNKMCEVQGTYIL